MGSRLHQMPWLFLLNHIQVPVADVFKLHACFFSQART